jgi:hypothetical protein
MGLGDPANLRKGTAEDLPPPTGDPLTDAINRAAVFSFFYPPYRDQVLAMIRGYAPVLGLNAQSDWNSIFKKTLDYQFGRYNNWSTYDNPSQTFFKVIEQNELPNREQVKSYIQGTSQYQQEAQSFTNAWNESNKSSGSFFNDVLTVAAIAVAIAYPQLAGYIGEAMGAGAAASASAIAVGNAVISGGMAAVQGKSVNDILEAAAIGGVGSAAGGAASAAAGGGVAGAAASGATSAGIGALARGEDVSDAVAKGGTTAAITAGIKGATATPGQAETVGTPTPGAPPPAEPGQEPGDFPAYSESGQPLTAEETAKKYADLYPEGRLPVEGESVAYNQGDKGINVPSRFLSQVLNLGMKTPGAGPTGSAPMVQGGTTAQSVGSAGSATEALGGGDVEAPETGGKRRNVWNVASLRNLQEGLGV